MKKTESFKIRPAGRHILTIGRDLIKDDYAAIVELVKNAYDADAENVKIEINKESDSKISIIVEDDGHGMTKDVIINKWLILSTDDKQTRKISPKGRIMQGKKGIGRYAASVLGNELSLDTTDTNGNTTTVFLDWEKFETAKFIDDVEVLITTKLTGRASGTKIFMSGGEEYAKTWDVTKIDNLRLELKKLVSPIQVTKEKFNITLSYSGFDLLSQISQKERIEPINIFEYFDYKIYGSIDGDEVSLTYQNQKKGMNETKKISVLEQYKGHKLPSIGKVDFDIRVYDRDQDSIGYLIERLPKNERINFTSIAQARSFLDKFVGVGVYRNGFRIRPLGDSGYDWLKLDERRVQNPSMRIGLNQVIGFINIESEEKSKLIEKSARDGLKDNNAYDMLIELAHNVIWELEDRRFKFRRTISENKKTDNPISVLTDTDTVKKEIRKVITDDTERERVEQIIAKDQDKKQKAIEELEQKIAVYQGQATLGKIMNVVLHEGRKPLNYFSNQASNIIGYIDLLKKQPDDEILTTIIKIMYQIQDNSKLLSELFRRLDPLAAGKRGRKKAENLYQMIEENFNIFREKLRNNNIKYFVDCDKTLKVDCWKNDIAIILSNLIDNSVYWLIEDIDNDQKNISISVFETEDTIILNFKDNGLGISEDNINTSIIFVPGYSTKPDGTGLGLALAGEASERNNAKLVAVYANKGAHFQITFNKTSKK